MELISVGWFSAGVSSAVAIKLVVDSLDHIIYTHIDDQHADSLRFVKDCESWFGKPVTIRQSNYKNVENACRMIGGRGYINGPAGAPCTKTLKRDMRKLWELEHFGCQFRYIWGMDLNEEKRQDRIREAQPKAEHVFPLIEKGITKEEAHKILNASGIKRPAMYDLGYNNNNCVGCVKGGMGYWNHVRVDFPEVFKSRAALERLIGGSCIKGHYLDELDPEAGKSIPPIVEDCGIMCESMAI